MIEAFTLVISYAIGGVLQPPPPYNRPYLGRLEVQSVDRSQVILWCHDPLAKACAFYRPGECRIVIPRNGYPKKTLAGVKTHELGHCNGWPGHHPGGR